MVVNHGSEESPKEILGLWNEVGCRDHAKDSYFCWKNGHCCTIESGDRQDPDISEYLDFGFYDPLSGTRKMLVLEKRKWDDGLECRIVLVP